MFYKSITLLTDMTRHFDVSKMFGTRHDSRRNNKVYYCKHCGNWEYIDLVDTKNMTRQVVTTAIVCTYCYHDTILSETPYKPAYVYFKHKTKSMK